MKYCLGRNAERIGYDFYCDIANRIVEGRKRKGWTQGQLAEAAGISKARISEMEGVKIRFSLPDIEALAKALDVSVDWLIEAELDSNIGECLYLVWNENFDSLKLYQRATSTRLAFLKMNERLKKSFRWLEPRDRVYVRLVGVPVTNEELGRRFPKRGTEKEDYIEPDKGETP